MSFRLDETNCFAPVYYGGKSIVEDVAKIARCEPLPGIAAQEDCFKDMGCEEMCENPAFKVFCFVYKCVSRLLSWIFLLGNSLVDSFTRIVSCGVSGIPQDALDASSRLVINEEMLSAVPEKVAMDKDQLSHADYDLDNLKEIFTQLFANKTAAERQALNQLVDNYISIVKGKKDSPKEADQELMLYAKNFMMKLEDGTIPLEKRQDTLEELCKAVGFCQSRVGRDTSRYFKRLNGTELSFEQNIRHWIQDLKEEILIEVFGDIHSIDDACQVIGKEWGLDVTAEAVSDVGARCVGTCMCISDATYRYHLNKNYTPARLIATIHTKIFSENCVEQANQFLQDKAEILPENWVQDFFDLTHEKRPLNMRAIAWMLQHFGDLI